MNHMATVITHNHIDQALALQASMHRHADTTMHVLITNPHRQKLPALRKELGSNVVLHTTEELTQDPNVGIIARFIVSKYSFLSLDAVPEHINPNDYLRWSLKSVFLRMLFNSGIENILYCDCDLFFYEDYTFVVDIFKESRIILSPHWRVIRPIIDNDFKFNFIHGLYNAGFVGVRRDASDMLEWWGEMCAHECSADTSMHGTYVDQKYLDIVPLYFDGVHILKHKGCNVAGWNLKQLERKTVDNKTTVNGDPLIFVHFSPVTIANIEGGFDPMLHDAYKAYQDELKTQRLWLMRKQMPECISQRQAEDDKKTVI